MDMQERHSTGAAHAQRSGGYQPTDQKWLPPRPGHGSKLHPNGPLNQITITSAARYRSHLQGLGYRPQLSEMLTAVTLQQMSLELHISSILISGLFHPLLGAGQLVRDPQNSQ